MQFLRPRVAHYAWGTTTDLPALLGVEATGEPFAELWVGAHPLLPAYLDPGPGTLADVAPKLPFLLKVLAVGAPLSIQTHPSDAQAVAGFARENALGLALDAPNRSYRDPQAKPELICALTEFEALCGFRPVPEAASDLDAIGLSAWATAVRTQPIQQTVGELLVLPQAEQTMLVSSVTNWDGCPEWLRLVASGYPSDAGVVVALLLQHHVLSPSEALVLAPGVLHAYLSGLGVEVMGSSDNVLRGGLTAKHVDVPELLEVLDPSAPVDRRTAGPTHVSSAGFGLTIGSCRCSGPALVLALEDGVAVGFPEAAQVLGRGRAVYVEPGESVVVSGRAATAFGT